MRSFKVAISFILVIFSACSFSGDFYTVSDFIPENNSQKREDGKEKAPQKLHHKNNMHKDMEAKAVARKIEAARIDKINTYVKKHPNSKRFKTAAIEKKLMIGMPKDLAIFSWGEPVRTYESVDETGEWFVLSYHGLKSFKVLNGKVIGWDSVK